MGNAGYAFISAYLKGQEAKIITSDHVDNMAKASGIQDILESVRDTDVGGYLVGLDVKTFDELDKYLWMYLGKCLEQLVWFKTVPSDMRKILKAYVVKYDVLNIKAALQAVSTGMKASLIPMGIIYNLGLLDELANAENTDTIIELLNGCQLGSYASIMGEYNADEGTKSRLLTEARLEEEYHRNLMEVTRRVKDGAILAKAFGTVIDMTNLQIILRAIIGGTGSEAAAYALSGGYMISETYTGNLISLKLGEIPNELKNTQYYDVAEEVVSSYDRTKSITVVDEVIEKHKHRLSSEMLSPRVLSPLMIAWYLIIKEIEIRNLRLIMKAAFDNTPLEEIKNYLVLSS